MKRQQAYEILMNYANGIGTTAVEYWSIREDAEKVRECVNVLMFQKEDDIEED